MSHDYQSFFIEDLDGGPHAFGDDIPLASAGQTHFSGPMTFKTIIGPFQGSMFDPITPGDPRWIWSWVDHYIAATFYQTGAEPSDLW